MPEKQAETDQSVSAVPGARVMKNFDAGGVPSQCAAKMAAFPVSAVRSASGPYHLGRGKRGLSRCGRR